MINYTSQRITKVLGLIALTGLSVLVDAQTTLNWAPAGPIYNAGRARNMIVDKNDPQVLYVGSASSGIFKSVDAGANWAPLDDQGSVRNISYLAQAFDGSIYAGTGEGFLRPGQKLKAQIGTGLYKLSPAGALTLVAPASQVGTVINRVACNKNNASMALATNSGIWYSTDGINFTQAVLPSAPVGTNVAGQDVKFDSNGNLYFSIGVESGVGNNSNASQIYKADPSFSNFANITPTSSSLPDKFYGRIELAVAPSNNNVIYASCSNKFVNDPSKSLNNTATLKGLFASYNGGNTWALVHQGSSQLDPLSNGGTRASGDYAHVLSVHPTNPDLLFFGGYSFYIFYRTNNSDTNPLGDWANIGQSFLPNNQYYLHENIHDIKYVAGANPKMYFITDAGIYRSIDLPQFLSANTNTTGLFAPSFQPFYKGLVTGQFNSVSIERFPIGEGVGSTQGGTAVNPYAGFIGGTGGNGLTYFSGNYPTVTSEVNYIGGEVYGSEYSKILPDAALATTGNGDIYRSTNVKTSNPTKVKINKYVGPLSKIAPELPTDFENSGFVTGTPFKLWENYGQIQNSPDSAVFYNDTVRYQASMSGVSELTSKTTFTFAAARPNKYALIDSIVVRTGTVVLPISGSSATLATPFTGNDSKTIYVGLPKNYTVNTSTTTLSSAPVGQSTIPVNFTLNAVSLIDNFSVSFPTAPFITKTVTSYPVGATGTNIVVADPASYYRVFATIFYKYKAGDIVSVVDNNISTKTNTFSTTLTKPLNWNYGSFPSQTITSTSTLAVTNPTYVLTSSSLLTPSVTQSTPVFTVSPYTNSTFTIQQFGDFALAGRKVTHTLTIEPTIYTITASTNPSPSPVYTLFPGSLTQTSNPVFTVAPIGTGTAGTTYTIQSGSSIETFSFAPTSFSIDPSVNTATTSLANVFLVSPTVSTTYTITQTSGTLTQVTNSAIATSTYVLEPGNVINTTDNHFTVTVPVGPAIVFTITGLSSDVLTGANTTFTASFPRTNTVSLSFGTVPFAAKNPPVKIPTTMSVRLAMVLNNSGNTGGSDAIVVSKNGLALNDPLNVVRVSQSGCYTDDANGNPTNSVITISGKPTLLEWSKSGTEIYFATSTNRLYRVSHINQIMDLSPSSYSGKFFTDVFSYGNTAVTHNVLNPASPYRTTLIGTFDKTITSISVSKDNKNLALTFTGPSTGTTGLVMYNSADARTSNSTTIGWSDKQGSSLNPNLITYCSLMEKDDSRKVFIGTDNGMFFTDDISATTVNWVNVNANVSNSNNKLPNVQVFDIKQQTFAHSDCYNSGQIYVATNGRGIWTNGTFFKPFLVGVAEEKQVVNGNNMSMYPNPTNGDVNVAFNSVSGETAIIQVMDLSGRMVYSEKIGKLNAGDVTYTFSTAGLTSGVYLVNISSDSGMKRISKLVVTK